MSKVLYIGFEPGVRDDASAILGDPPKPGNWKQETYEEKLPEMREKALASAHNDLRVSAIKDIVVLDPSTGTTSGYETLLDLTDAYIVGFSPKFRLRQAAWNNMRDLGGPVPKWIWCEGYDGVEFIDLYKLSGAKEDGMRLVDMVNFLLPAGVEGSTPARQDAAAALEVAKKMGITDPSVLHFS